MVIFPREPHYCVRNDATGPQGSESPFSLIPKGSRPVHSPERVGSTKTPDHKKEDLNFDRVKGTMTKDDQRAQNGVLTSPTSVIPPPSLPHHQISQIHTSSAHQNPFEGNLYDSGGLLHNEPLYDKDGLLVYAPPENTMKNLTAPPEEPEAAGTFTSTQYAAIFEVDERKDFLTCHFLMDTEHLSSTRFGLELQTLKDDMLSTDNDDINLFWYTFWREWHDIGVILENRYPPEEIKSLLSPWAT